MTQIFLERKYFGILSLWQLLLYSSRSIYIGSFRRVVLEKPRKGGGVPLSNNRKYFSQWFSLSFHCLDDTRLTHLFKNQSLIEDVNTLIFTQILTIFSKLEYLTFCPSLFLYQEICFDISPPTVFSSTLLELHVSLENFTDYLYFTWWSFQSTSNILCLYFLRYFFTSNN